MLMLTKIHLQTLELAMFQYIYVVGISHLAE